MIAIIDYDIGNLAAVANMLNRLGIACEITKDSEKIEKADKIILPGNGAFDACMQCLRDTGLVPLLEHKVLVNKTPLLGICVGAQMLGHGSEEGYEKGLGWIDMHVHKFPVLPNLRIPNMGWRNVTASSKAHALTQNVNENTRFYFVHSYYMKPVQADNILLSTYYGIEFAAAVAHDNIIGVQFHPEKSHQFGKQLLERFGKDF